MMSLWSPWILQSLLMSEAKKESNTQRQGPNFDLFMLRFIWLIWFIWLIQEASITTPSSNRRVLVHNDNKTIKLTYAGKEQCLIPTNGSRLKVDALRLWQLVQHRSCYKCIRYNKWKIRSLAHSWGLCNLKVLECMICLGSSMVGKLVSISEDFVAETANIAKK